nr:hypothetical protein [Tanacetum cinerariifolium]
MHFAFIMSQDILIRASRLKKVMEAKAKKSRKFLDDLHNNAFSGTNEKDAIKHIEYYLKIIDPIILPNVDHDKLRVVVFPISLARGARRWFDRTKESITCWVDLTVVFFGKYYMPSRIKGNNTLEIKWDPTNPRFKGWLAKKFVNYKTMEFTKGALWDYCKIGGDETEVSDDESFDLKEYWTDKEEETAEIFKIETDVFNYETPLCLAFNEFNYLLKVDPDLLTKDIMGLWGLKPMNIIKKTGFMNGTRIGDESSNDCWKRRKSHEIYYHDYDEGEYENETHEEGHELCGIKTRKVPVCQIKRYKMIKYSFNNKEEYVAVKEDEYDDLTITSEEACRAYQEIFRMMDEGWMVTRTE